MRAIVAPRPGGPEALQIVDRPDPAPGPGELLVAVKATAVNRADIMQREGNYPPPEGASDVLGLEMAGEVVALGDQVSEWRVGDRVCTVLSGGGYASFVNVPAAVAIPVPDNLSFAQAGGIAEVFLTAYDNVMRRGRLKAGETLLIHGGGSGVGTAAIQIAKRAGARVLVTAGSAAKLEACAQLGADEGINYREEDFSGRAREFTDGRGVDVILDHIGAAYLQPNLDTLALEGRLVIIGLMRGAKAELNLGLVLSRRLSVMASTLRARNVEEKAALVADFRRDVLPGLANGELRPVIDRVVPFDQVAHAHRVMEASEHIGKIVLTLE